MLNKIKLSLKKSGILSAKYIYIYSDFRFFFKKFEKNSKKNIFNLINFFTKKGITCVLPSFSYTNSGIFDIRKTKSKLGFLPNFIIDNLQFERSNHPIFSYIAVGKNKKFVKKLGKSAFGIKSLHQSLKGKNCYFLHFDRPIYNGNTLIHHIEQKNNINYRFEKTFKTKIFDGSKYIGTNYKAFVRKDIKNSYSLGTFKKVYKRIMIKKYFFRKRIENLELQIYPYDKFYEDLDRLLKKDNKIFIKAKN